MKKKKKKKKEKKKKKKKKKKTKKKGGKRWEEMGRWRSSSRTPTAFAIHVFIIKCRWFIIKLQMDKLVEDSCPW